MKTNSPQIRFISSTNLSFINKVIYFLFILFFIFPNLKLPLSIGNRFISFSEILAVIFITIILFKQKKFFLGDILFFLGFLLICFISTVLSLSPIESFKSLISLFLYSSLTFFIIEYVRENHYIIDFLLDAFLSSIFILAIYAVLQSLTIYFLGPSEIMTYPFGTLTWQRQKLFLLRANSLYYEPNIFGMISVFAFFINLQSRKKGIIWNTITLLGILLTFSTTTYFIFLISLVVRILIENYYASPLKKTQITSFLIFLACVICLCYTLGINDNLSLSVPILNRIEEISVPGSSGFYRVMTPILIIPFMLQNFPFGIGIGTTDLFLSNPPYEIAHYFIMGNNYYGTTIDNIYTGWLISFGFMSILIFLLFAILLYITLYKISISIATCTFLFCLGTGSFAIFDFWSIILINILLIIRTKKGM